MYIEPGKLWVVQMASHHANQLRRHVGRWPNSDKRGLGDQLLRSADSIGANIAEGEGRGGTTRDCLRFLSISRGSLQETIHWIRQAIERELIEENEGKTLLLNYFRLSVAINAFIRSKSKPPTTTE